jgi:CO/xanthine dehydrogenase FAD-binding subunit
MDNKEYFKPNNYQELNQLVKDFGAKATFIAGGTDLIPQIRTGSKSPEFFIDIGEINELLSIEESKNSISIGAATKIADVASDSIVTTHCPTLASAAGHLGNTLTRNRATIGGNIANASPCCDTAPPLLTLNASVVIRNMKGETRRLSIDDFFLSYKKTALAQGELITRIIVPKRTGKDGGSFIKIGQRNSAAISMISMALMMEIEAGNCKEVKIAMGGMAPVPIRAFNTERLLKDKKIDDSLIESGAKSISNEFSPISDIRGSEVYRRHLTEVLFKRSIENSLKQIGD